MALLVNGKRSMHVICFYIKRLQGPHLMSIILVLKSLQYKDLSKKIKREKVHFDVLQPRMALVLQTMK